MDDRCLVHCGSVRPEMREGVISCTLLAKFARNGAIFGAVITESASGVIFRVHCSSVQVKLREGMISCTLLAKFEQNGAFRGAVITKSASGANFRVRCGSVQGERLIEMQVWMQKSVWM